MSNDKEISESLAQGHGYIRHNNREFFSPNVDKSHTHENVYFKQQDILDAYEECFGKAIQDYNEKCISQGHPERQIDGAQGYLDKIKNSKNKEKPYYEIVVQVGNHEDIVAGRITRDECKDTLTDYMKNFAKRNPNIHVFNAALHMDEMNGTPHLHIDYIPVAHDYKRGMETRNGLDKALRQQGADPGKNTRLSNATLAWEDKEKDALEEALHEHGYERKAETGLHREHLSVDQYKAVQADGKNRLDNAKQTLDKLPELDDMNNIKTRPNKMNKDEIIIKKDDWNKAVKQQRDLVLATDEVYKTANNFANASHEMTHQLTRERQDTRKMSNLLGGVLDEYSERDRTNREQSDKIARLEHALEYEREEAEKQKKRADKLQKLLNETQKKLDKTLDKLVEVCRAINVIGWKSPDNLSKFHPEQNAATQRLGRALHNSILGFLKPDDERHKKANKFGLSPALTNAVMSDDEKKQKTRAKQETHDDRDDLGGFNLSGFNLDDIAKAGRKMAEEKEEEERHNKQKRKRGQR